ncbi:MAG: 16S rRNA (cytosine(1402)-N(4))-methyltransferase RsmH [bacterium]
MFHEPVLVDQVVRYLVGATDGVYLDGTVGGGGHAEAILAELDKGGKLLALDRDDAALQYAKQRLSGFGSQVIFEKSSFGNFDRVLKGLKMNRINGLLLDLGVSSYQIDAPERGFSYRLAGKLDMRMSQDQSLTAEEIVSTYSEDELVQIFHVYGEERRSKAVARVIVKERKRGHIATTEKLTEVISTVLPYDHRIKSLSRIFQALRIAVNDELRILSEALSKILDYLAPAGRIVVISYHSLEDRIVKDFFRRQATACLCPPELPVCVCEQKARLKILTKRPVCPAEKEIAKNPRSRSAKLRATEVLEEKF